MSLKYSFFLLLACLMAATNSVAQEPPTVAESIKADPYKQWIIGDYYRYGLNEIENAIPYYEGMIQTETYLGLSNLLSLYSDMKPSVESKESIHHLLNRAKALGFKECDLRNCGDTDEKNINQVSTFELSHLPEIKRLYSLANYYIQIDENLTKAELYVAQLSKINSMDSHSLYERIYKKRSLFYLAKEASYLNRKNAVKYLLLMQNNDKNNCGPMNRSKECMDRFYNHHLATLYLTPNTNVSNIDEGEKLLRIEAKRGSTWGLSELLYLYKCTRPDHIKYKYWVDFHVSNLEEPSILPICNNTPIHASLLRS